MPRRSVRPVPPAIRLAGAAVCVAGTTAAMTAKTVGVACAVAPGIALASGRLFDAFADLPGGGSGLASSRVWWAVGAIAVLFLVQQVLPAAARVARWTSPWITRRRLRPPRSPTGLCTNSAT